MIIIIYLFNSSQEIKKSYLKPKKVIKQRILKFKKIILKEFGKFSLVPSEKKRPLFCDIIRISVINKKYSDCNEEKKN